MVYTLLWIFEQYGVSLSCEETTLTIGQKLELFTHIGTKLGMLSSTSSSTSLSTSLLSLSFSLVSRQAINGTNYGTFSNLKKFNNPNNIFSCW